jgi:hypothetical protein
MLSLDAKTSVDATNTPAATTTDMSTTTAHTKKQRTLANTVSDTAAVLNSTEGATGTLPASSSTTGTKFKRSSSAAKPIRTPHSVSNAPSPLASEISGSERVTTSTAERVSPKQKLDTKTLTSTAETTESAHSRGNTSQPRSALTKRPAPPDASDGVALPATPTVNKPVRASSGVNSTQGTKTTGHTSPAPKEPAAEPPKPIDVPDDPPRITTQEDYYNIRNKFREVYEEHLRLYNRLTTDARRYVKATRYWEENKHTEQAEEAREVLNRAEARVFGLAGKNRLKHYTRLRNWLQLAKQEAQRAVEEYGWQEDLSKF